MTSLLKSLFKPTHEQLIRSVEEVLRDEAWGVQREPIVGTLRPDIVASSPDGTAFVIEVKQSKATARLGAVAQVEAYRNALEQEGCRAAKGLLVLYGDAPEALDVVAKRADVILVRTESVDEGAVHEALVSAGILGKQTAGMRNGGAQAA